MVKVDNHHSPPLRGIHIPRRSVVRWPPARSLRAVLLCASTVMIAQPIVSQGLPSLRRLEVVRPTVASERSPRPARGRCCSSPQGFGDEQRPPPAPLAPLIPARQWETAWSDRFGVDRTTKQRRPHGRRCLVADFCQVEAEGVEPSSCMGSSTASTCVAHRLIFPAAGW